MTDPRELVWSLTSRDIAHAAHITDTVQEGNELPNNDMKQMTHLLV